MVRGIDPSFGSPCCLILEVLNPTQVPKIEAVARGLPYWGKTMQIYKARNFTYLSFVGVLMAAIGTAVSNAYKSRTAEYTFIAVLGGSFLGSLICLKKLNDRILEFWLEVDNFIEQKKRQLDPNVVIASLQPVEVQPPQTAAAPIGYVGEPDVRVE